MADMNQLHLEDMGPVSSDDEMDTASSSPQKAGTTRAITEDGGLHKEVLAVGTGRDCPEPGDEVIVHYTGTLESDGSKFDSSRDRKDPFKFTIGKGQVIKGWDQGVATMRKGERAILKCAPEYGYGANGSPPTIPPGATLLFDVELLSWKSVKDICGDGSIIKKIVESGKGYKKPTPLDEVVVTYVAKKADSTVVASAEGEGVSFVMGEGHLCPGIKRVLETMHSGEQVKCFMKGAWVEGCPGIAADEELHVSLTLVKICEVQQVTVGVVKKTLTEGGGYEKPNDGSKVSLRFTAMLQDGTVFDRTDGDEPAQITVDEEEIPAGLEAALVTMKKGETALVTLQPEQAFGAEGAAKPLAAVPPGAVVSYEVTLIDFENEKQAYAMDTEEKFAACEKRKEAGNGFFKAKKFERAIKRYGRALEPLESDYSFSSEEKDRAKKLKVPLNVNMAACHLKLKQWGDVKKTCSKALEMESTNVKALFRRAQAHTALGDHDEAAADLKAVLAEDAGNREARAELKKVREAQKKAYSKQKAVFGNMFEKMGELYDKEAEAASGTTSLPDADFHLTPPAELGPEDEKPMELHIGGPVGSETDNGGKGEQKEADEDPYL